MTNRSDIPIILLKTRNTPTDGYAEYFSSTSLSNPDTHPESSHDSSIPNMSRPSFKFTPIFIPVLEHTPNTQNLAYIEKLLQSGNLQNQYGGIIFTSQRAVEGWKGVVERVERDLSTSSSKSQSHTDLAKGSLSVPTTDATALEYTSSTLPLQDADLAFPLYVVGPATQRALNTLLDTSTANPASPFARLNPTISGAHTGSGAVLAPFILQHYNALHVHRRFTFWDAPRLPFIPLVGPGPSPSKTAAGQVTRGGMVRLERDDPRLRKKDLLFLVGEQRRDVIPKTLMDENLGEEKVAVREVEVYSTTEREGVRDDIRRVLDDVHSHDKNGGNGRIPPVVVVVVFSPQGCESMLRAIGFLDEDGRRLTDQARRRWDRQEKTDAIAQPNQDPEPINQRTPSNNSTTNSASPVIVTIGPTTRTHLQQTFGFEPDVVAQTPSPEGVGEGVVKFLRGKGLV